MPPTAYILGGAIVLNTAVLCVGLLWAKRQLKRVAAEREAEACPPRMNEATASADLPPHGDDP